MDELRHARHNLRGRLNAVKLCVCALEIMKTRDEKLEFLELIEQSADKLIVSLDELETLLDRTASPQG